MPSKPEFDYANWPDAPRVGFRHDGNNNFATRALFLETCEDFSMVQYTLTEDAKWCPEVQRWLPSAWMIYIHSSDEYEAARRIAGNVRGWEAIKGMTLPWRGKFITQILPDWEAEQIFLQKSKLKRELLASIRAGRPGIAGAARMVLQIIEGKNPVGRPKGKDKGEPEPTGDVEGDSARIFDFQQARNKLK